MGVEKLAENLYQPLKIVDNDKPYELSVAYKAPVLTTDAPYKLATSKLRVLKNDNLTTITNGKTFFCD